MHIIIAGAARSGKTTLSKMLRDKGFIHYKMDSIKRGVCKYFDVKTMYWTDFSDGVTTIIEQVINDEVDDNIIFDTPHISVLDARRLVSDNTIVIFLGYDHMSFDTFYDNIKKYDKNTWCGKLSYDELKEIFDDSVRYSIENKNACYKYGIPYFDVSDDKMNTINSAYSYILAKLELNK